ncbi:MAG: hypothetical protein IT431_03045 [Phycisphaerales bacterium]|nr:hypothetical protein [Phycisphaerales bacterium]
MHGNKVRYHAALGLLLAAGLPAIAHAQTAVGDGRALETTLQTNGIPGMMKTRRSFANELAFREAIVSGTAPAGMSFRGEPGDMLPSRYDFRGELAEDALFAYRRDSLYSGLSGKGIRGTDALQYQFALTTGGQVPETLSGQLSYARAGGAERSSDPDHPLTRDLSGSGEGLRRVDPDQSQRMPGATETGTSLIQPVRSLSTYTANRGMQPTLVGLMQNRVTHQAAGQTASPLLGVQVQSVESLRSPIRPTPSATPATNGTPGLTPAPSGFEGVGGVDPAKPAKPAYEQLIDRFKELSPAPDPDAKGIPAWANDLISVQRALRGIETPKLPEVQATPGTEEPNPYDGVIGVTPDTLVKTGVEAGGPTGSTFDMEVLRRVRQAGGVTQSLIPTDLPQIDRYAAYMQTGQELLASERYFDSEEYFISAMSSRPGDVNALVGRAHSQLGAGLFLSAGLNVRQLLIRHPEVAGMRYAAALLPGPARMDQLAKTFRDTLESPASGADSGLLLAYLGFQREREADIREGLAAVEKWGDSADQRLAELLRVVWLAEGADDSPPADTGG